MISLVSVNKTSKPKNIEIYVIDNCPYCINEESELPNLLINEFGDNVNIEIINVSTEERKQKYERFVSNIENFDDTKKNHFPLTNIKDYFVIFGYGNGFGNEIVNDILRIDNESFLGVTLSDYRYFIKEDR